MKKLIVSGLMALSVMFSYGQEKVDKICSTSIIYNKLIKEDPTILERREEFNRFAEEWTSQHYGEVKTNAEGKKVISYVIPVVWHVIHNNGNSNISKATIDNEMDLLNKTFQKQNFTLQYAHDLFVPIIADCEIELRLARLDPDGNCTEGITRTYSTKTNSMDESVKFLPGAESWNRNGRYYLNIWVGTSLANGAGGYAYYPGTINMSQDGLVLRHGQLGSTVTHEVGHWLNLAHCWGDSNDQGVSCGNDGVADTPTTVGQTGCSETTQSCGSIDNVQNFMDYNPCDVMFTEGQKQRMHAALERDGSSNGFRKTMWSDNNRLLTGTDDPYEWNPVCALQGADFTYNKEYICEGDQVNFSDNGTYNGIPTQWDWTFTGGTPSTSNVANPSITYNTEGVYNVTYAPGNAVGFTAPVVKNNIITVSSVVADYTIPFSEGMENTTTFANEWTIETQSGNGWLNDNTVAYTGNRSLRIYNYSNSSGDITEAISPSYDLSTMTNPKLEYKWSFARKTSGGNDQFIIYYSLDCGETWAIKAVKAGSSMATVTATNTPFYPSSTADWKTATVDLSSLANESNVRFKLYFKNAGGNNFFIDDLNIFGDVFTSVNENEQVNNLKVYPNPTKESAIISFNLTNNVKNLKIVLRDVLGQEVTQLVSGASFSAGKYTVAIDQQQKLSSGLYFIEFNVDNNVQIEKLIVE